jgi:uncharacterized protein (DUF433 family)
LRWGREAHGDFPFARENKGAYRWNMLDWSQCPAVERDPAKVSGAWVFKDTRVPVRALFENIDGGATVKDFLEWFPGVERAQVDAVLAFAEASLSVANHKS